MRKVVLAIVAALSAFLAVPALAVDGTLSAATPTYAWEGGPMNGIGSNDVPAQYSPIRCTEAYQCENTHIELKEAGSLTVDIKAGDGSNDLDVRLYKSDADGTAPGTPTPGSAPEPAIAEDARTEKDAKITAKGLKPGFYVIQVAAFSATNGVYNGTAAFTPAAPPASATPATPPATTGPAAPQTAPAPASQPTQTSPTPAQIKADEAKRKKALAKCNKKAKKIKNAKKRKAALKKCKKKHAKKRA